MNRHRLQTIVSFLRRLFAVLIVLGLANSIVQADHHMVHDHRATSLVVSGEFSALSHAVIALPASETTGYGSSYEIPFAAESFANHLESNECCVLHCTADAALGCEYTGETHVGKSQHTIYAECMKPSAWMPLPKPPKPGTTLS